MAAFVHSIEIDRRPEDVFAYLDDLARHHEWQDDVISTSVLTEGPTRVGTKVSERRRTTAGPRDIGYEVVTHEPPRSFGFHGTDGPVRPVGSATLEPLDGGTRTRMTLTFDFEARGVGKLIAPLARKQAAKAIPLGHTKLKAIMEGRT
jgi:uncharacterized protein YndB with AHSA1/START domain